MNKFAERAVPQSPLSRARSHATLYYEAMRACRFFFLPLPPNAEDYASFHAKVLASARDVTFFFSLTSAGS